MADASRACRRLPRTIEYKSNRNSKFHVINDDPRHAARHSCGLPSLQMPSRMRHQSAWNRTMIAFLKRIWPFGSGYEARILNRDARYIIEDAETRFNDERLTHMANATREYLNRANEQLAQPHLKPENVLFEFQRQHRNARRERQDLALSALTLVIIHLRAQKYPEECAPTVSLIAEFVEEWASEDDDDAPTGRIGRLEA